MQRMTRTEGLAVASRRPDEVTLSDLRHDVPRLGAVPLAVEFRGECCRVAHQHASGFQAVPPPHFRYKRMPQLVWMPPRYAGLLAGPLNSATVRVGREPITYSACCLASVRLLVLTPVDHRVGIRLVYRPLR